MDERIKKLPKWAQRKIEVLENNLRATKERLATFMGEDGTNDIVSNPYGDPPVSLPNDLVRFRIEGGYVDICIENNGRDLKISSDGFSLYPAILPDVSNVFTVRLLER